MPSTTLQPGPINHIALPTVDAERGARFYCDVLGFRLVSRPSFSFDGRWLYREGVGLMIHLIHVPEHRPASGPINTLGSHFAMYCGDIDSALQLLAARGVETVRRMLPDHGYRQIFFRDPDGNLIELGEWPDVEAMAIDLAADDHEPSDQ